ncbi:MAG TPA: DUF4129 domain-containing protein [Actinoplanes sp.]
MNVTALRRWWPLAAILGLLFLTSLAATRSAPQLDQLAPDPEPAATAPPPLLPPDPQQQPTGAGSAPARAAPTGLPDWIGTAALAVLIIVAVVLAAVLVWAFVRDQLRRQARRAPRPAPAVPSQPTADEVVAALDAGLEELSDTDRDPRRAVIACWVRLEQAAAAAGTPRHPGDTPTDLVSRLLAEQRVDARLLSALRDVYREARYATHTVDDRMRAEARGALQRLRTDLGAGALR